MQYMQCTCKYVACRCRELIIINKYQLIQTKGVPMSHILLQPKQMNMFIRSLLSVCSTITVTFYPGLSLDHINCRMRENNDA